MKKWATRRGVVESLIAAAIWKIGAAALTGVAGVVGVHEGYEAAGWSLIGVAISILLILLYSIVWHRQRGRRDLVAALQSLTDSARAALQAPTPESDSLVQMLPVAAKADQAPQVAAAPPPAPAPPPMLYRAETPVSTTASSISPRQIKEAISMRPPAQRQTEERLYVGTLVVWTGTLEEILAEPGGTLFVQFRVDGILNSARVSPVPGIQYAPPKSKLVIEGTIRLFDFTGHLDPARILSLGG